MTKRAATTTNNAESIANLKKAAAAGQTTLSVVVTDPVTGESRFEEKTGDLNEMLLASLKTAEQEVSGLEGLEKPLTATAKSVLHVYLPVKEPAQYAHLMRLLDQIGWHVVTHDYGKSHDPFLENHLYTLGLVYDNNANTGKDAPVRMVLVHSLTKGDAPIGLDSHVTPGAEFEMWSLGFVPGIDLGPACDVVEVAKARLPKARVAR